MKIKQSAILLGVKIIARNRIYIFPKWMKFVYIFLLISEYLPYINICCVWHPTVETLSVEANFISKIVTPLSLSTIDYVFTCSIFWQHHKFCLDLRLLCSFRNIKPHTEILLKAAHVCECVYSYVTVMGERGGFKNAGS